MMRTIKTRQDGFTLIEMMVALAIFSMISVAGVALLQSASNSQLAVKQRLSHAGDTVRAITLMEADLAQAVSRPVRNSSQTTVAAFSGKGGEVAGQMFGLTRAGQSNLDNSARPLLQHVVYGLDNGALSRTSWSMLDGGQPRKTPLLDGVVKADVRFRDAEGNWRQDWEANDPMALPRAVEILLQRQGEAPVTLLFLIGTGGIRAPQLTSDGGDGTPD